MSVLSDFPRYPIPDAVLRLPDVGHAVIEASAGTGKTHTIEHLVVDLIVSRGVTIDEVLVVTFTEKAASELKRRIRSKLRELVLLGETKTTLSPENCWVIDADVRRKLETALANFDETTITTVHAFCRRVLTEQAFLVGALLRQRHVDDRALFARAFKDVLRTELARRDDLAPFLSAWLEVSHATVRSLEKLLFDASRAAAELVPALDEQRFVRALVSTPTVAVTSDELKANGVSGRSIEKVLHTVQSLNTVLREHRSTRDVATALAELDRVDVSYLRDKIEGFDELDELIRAAPPFAAVITARFLPVVEARLAALKRERGEYDYDDMLGLLARTLDGPHGRALATYLQSRYRAALIDEFQDTDGLQWSIFEKLFFVSGAKTPLRLVGDPKQAIYGFRGADVHVYLSAKSAVVSRSAVLQLVDNFRSTPALIEAFNLIFDQEAERPFFTGTNRYDRPLQPGRPDLNLTTADGVTAPPLVLLQCDDPSALAERIAAEIEALTQHDDRALYLGDESEHRRLGTNDIFVLTRTKNEADRVGAALAARGIPHATYKRDGLFQSREAADVLSLLSALVHPRDRSRRLEAWMTGFFGLSLRDLQQCGRVKDDHPLMARLTAWKRLAETRDYVSLFGSILEDSGVLRRQLFSGRGERSALNYCQVLDVLLEEADQSGASLPELVRTLESYVRGDGLDPGSARNVMRLESDNAVQVMTIHMAKGLEAGVVFVYGFTQIPPTNVNPFYENGRRHAYIGKLKNAPATVREAVAREVREEDQRLFYVALTRAQARLYLPLLPGRHARLGCYEQLNERLHETRGAAFAVDESTPPPPSWDDAPGTTTLGSWRPPSELFAVKDNAALFESMRGDRSGHVLTSYSRMKSLAGGYRPPVDTRADVVEPDSALPGGRRVGVFLHDVLESLDLGALASAPDLETWRRQPAVRELFRSALRRNGLEVSARDASEGLIHRALTSTVQLGGERLERGFATLTKTVREVEFIYPYPEADESLGRGYVKGYLDLVFEHNGKTYFCDWKSDVLPTFQADALSEHVRRNYALQAKLYALALVRMLDIEDDPDFAGRFGGIVYCFLRGMPSNGIYFARPSWSTVLKWRDELIREERVS